jgi:TolB-like protein
LSDRRIRLRETLVEVDGLCDTEPIMHGLRWPESVLSYVVAALASVFPSLSDSRGPSTYVKAASSERRPFLEALSDYGSAARAFAGGHRRAGSGTGLGLVLRPAARFSWRPARVGRSLGINRGVPFADLSPAKDKEYFADGVAEEILNSLAQVDGLHVAGRTSSFSFKGKGADLATIAQTLHVAHILEGSVRREGDHVRISAQLIGAADGYQPWSKTFDRDLTSAIRHLRRPLSARRATLCIGYGTDISTIIDRKFESRRLHNSADSISPGKRGSRRRS